MKGILFIITLMVGFSSHSQSYEDSIIESRVIHMGELIDTATHILNQDEIDHFEGLAYFDVDSTYRIRATFTKSIGKKFKMPTSTERQPIYRRYGYVDFTIDGKTQRLTAYQNMALRKQKGYKNYLFIPFRDSTCGNESYGGGRYLDVEIPEGTTIMLDFNKIYNPYCVYSHRYSCPIPPVENTLTIPIRAGEKVPVGYSTEH
jgi:uncharacterized protein (DUF1684 family)